MSAHTKFGNDRVNKLLCTNSPGSLQQGAPDMDTRESCRAVAWHWIAENNPFSGSKPQRSSTGVLHSAILHLDKHDHSKSRLNPQPKSPSLASLPSPSPSQ